ncbi:MAG: OmpA family protein [Cyclobacteriaceae bacterium]|nr:PD40 domain-containing protein [Cyclobacteriaceae bacterium]MCH8517063.1 OmpA family protein [Cyclobacteriaceae bacterium]
MKNIYFFCFIFILTFDLKAQLDSTYLERIQEVDVISTKEFVEYAPSISADGKYMILESNRLGGWKLFYTRLGSDGKWSEPSPIKKVNAVGDSLDLIGGPTISYDGNELYFFASFKGGYGAEDIYLSKREGDDWGIPVNLGPPINTAKYEGFPSISPDGNTLYFIRQNPAIEDRVCYQIYVSHKDENQNWSEAETLPYPINLSCEKAPRIMADNKTLIFASDREGGRGGYDLYQTQQDEDGEWSDPVNLDFVNTPGNDQFACISAAGDVMYFNTMNGIYKTIIPEEFRQFMNITIQGYVTDADSGGPLTSQIKVIDALTSKLVTTINNESSDGRYSLVLTAGRYYNVEFTQTDYSTANYSYDLRNLESYVEYDQDVSLFKTVKLKVNVNDQDLFDPIAAKVEVRSVTDNRKVAQGVASSFDGSLILDIPIEDEYIVAFTADNYEETSFNFNLKSRIRYRDFEFDTELIPLKKKMRFDINDVNSNEKVRSKVILRNKDRDEVIEVYSDEEVALRVGDRYEIEVPGDRGYSFASSEITVGADSKFVQNVQMEVTKLEKDVSLALKDILFETNSATLGEISYKELDRVINLMLNNPGLMIEIAAHTDDVGKKSYNQLLSEKRAESVLVYLVENQIPIDRLQSKGYGMSEPLVPNIDDESRARNRRVELRILELNQ